MPTRLMPHYAEGTGQLAVDAVVDGQAVWVPDNPASTTGTTTDTTTDTVTTKDGRTVNTSFIPEGYTANIQGIRPQDVSMGMLTGPVYDWYDPQAGSYGYFKDLLQFAGTGAAAGGGGGGAGGGSAGGMNITVATGAPVEGARVVVVDANGLSETCASTNVPPMSIW